MKRKKYSSRMVTFLRNIKKCNVSLRSLGYDSNPTKICELKRCRILETKTTCGWKIILFFLFILLLPFFFHFLKKKLKKKKSHFLSPMAATLGREQYVYMAKLAEQAERYEEMVQFMEQLVTSAAPSSSELTVEERNLLSVAYKNVIGSLRAAWRIVSSIEQKEESRKNEEHAGLVKDYRSKVEAELSSVCSGILRLLDEHLIPSAAGSESKVFYMKMKGDYHRYMAEFKSGEERKGAAEDTMVAYKAAQVIINLVIS